MKNRKRQGPKTEPWGTPEETLITSEMQSKLVNASKLESNQATSLYT